MRYNAKWKGVITIQAQTHPKCVITPFIKCFHVLHLRKKRVKSQYTAWISGEHYLKHI